MNLVTFCSHQAFLHLFHKSEHNLDLIQIPKAKRFLQNWNPKVRPLPAKWRVIDLEFAKNHRHKYQVAMAHNINDYMDLLPLGLPIILVMHTSLSSRFAEERTQTDKAEYRQRFAELISRTGGHFCFVTPSKQNDWGLPGEVIVAGVDPGDYDAYSGELTRLLRVSNHLRRRGRILGYREHLQLTRGFSMDLIGENPAPAHGPAQSWAELKCFYKTRRALIHTANPAYEDGYNLAVIEAMACGMPVLSTANPSSPIQDGVNGFLKDDIPALREDILALMNDQQLSLKLGRAARETVRDLFHYSRFIREWDDLLERVCQI